MSAGPSYIFLALDHDAAFIAQSALASLPMNAATILMCLVFVHLAQHRGMLVSLAAGIAVWFVFAALVRAFEWTLPGGILVNVAALGRLPAAGAALPRRQNAADHAPLVRHPAARRAGRDAGRDRGDAVEHVGPTVSGIIALFPVVFTSLILILQPRIGGPATAAVLANGQWGLIGFGAAIVVLHLPRCRSARAAALGLALATCVALEFRAVACLRPAHAAISDLGFFAALSLSA